MSKIDTRCVVVENVIFLVPPNIQRIECRKTIGWQVKIGKNTKFFSDKSCGDAFCALQAAVKHKLVLLREAHGRLPYGQGRLHQEILMAHKIAA